MNEKKCFPWVGLRISFLYIFCSSSTTDNALFTFLFFYFLGKMSILYFWEISFLLYPPSLHSSPPPVCLQAFLRILVPSKLYWRWWKGLLVVKLLFRGYFLIDASDKVGVGHSMQRREVFLPGNFLLLSLPPSPPLFHTLEHHKTSIVLILFPSLGGWNSRSIFISSGLG